MCMSERAYEFLGLRFFVVAEPDIRLATLALIRPLIALVRRNHTTKNCITQLEPAKTYPLISNLQTSNQRKDNPSKKKHTLCSRLSKKISILQCRI